MKMMLGILLLFCVATLGSGAPCNTTALSKLLVTADVRTCRTDSGYNPTSMAAATNAQVDAVCKSTACTQALNAVKQTAPNECTIGGVRLYADVIDPLQRRCGRNSGSANAAGSVGSAGSVSGSGSGPTVGDVGSQSASGSIVGGTVTSASASMSGSTTKLPATSTPRPTTRPRSNTPSTAPGNGGAEAPTLSTFSAVAVLAAVVAAIL